MIMLAGLQNDAYAVTLEKPLLHSAPLRTGRRSKDEPLRRQCDASFDCSAQRPLYGFYAEMRRTLCSWDKRRRAFVQQ